MASVELLCRINAVDSSRFALLDQLFERLPLVSTQSTEFNSILESTGYLGSFRSKCFISFSI
jgi:hypothetical protein